MAILMLTTVEEQSISTSILYLHSEEYANSVLHLRIPSCKTSKMSLSCSASYLTMSSVVEARAVNMHFVVVGYFPSLDRYSS